MVGAAGRRRCLHLHGRSRIGQANVGLPLVTPQAQLAVDDSAGELGQVGVLFFAQLSVQDVQGLLFRQVDDVTL